MQKSLIDLSEEYFTNAKNMDALINNCSKKLNEAKIKHNYKKCYLLKRKLAVFYDQRREMISTAYKLKNYYKTPEEISQEALSNNQKKCEVNAA